jgi:hypothetical protein
VGESPSPSDRQLYTHLSVDGLGDWGGGCSLCTLMDQD